MAVSGRSLMSRAFGILVTLAWLAAMAALIHRDVLPYWLAQEPPASAIPPGAYQVAITTEDGHRVGTTWVTTTPSPTATTVHSLTHLEIGSAISLLPAVGDVLVDTSLTYHEGEQLQSFSFLMETAVLSARVRGFRYHNEFSCEAVVGAIKKTLSFDGDLSKYLGDSIRPFTHLEGLHVGQSWRLRSINPMSLLQGGDVELATQLVNVTRRERIDHAGESVECFRIETDDTTAWADDSGRILRQELQIPLLGKWIMTDEPFEPNARRRAKDTLSRLQQQKVADRLDKPAAAWPSPR